MKAQFLKTENNNLTYNQRKDWLKVLYRTGRIRLFCFMWAVHRKIGRWEKKGIMGWLEDRGAKDMPK